MKINRHNTITALACAALLAVATTSIAQPLVNGGFESDAPGTLTTGWLINNAGTTSDTYARSGTKSLLIDSTGVGQWWSPNVYQSFSAVAGDEFKLEGYMFKPTAVAGASFGLFKIEFRDAGNVILQPASVSIGGNAAAPFYGAESTPFLNSASTSNVWLYSRTQAVAPVNTATVWFYALNVNQVNNLMYFDDIVATKILVSPPTTSITSPANGATVGANFTINANASVTPGSVTNVYFYTNNVFIGSDDTAPYSVAVTGATDGPRALKVVAYGNNGANFAVTSSVVNVTVSSTATVYVDSSKNWLGYMNVLATPQAGSFYIFGSGWAVADLRANWSGSTLTLSPNTIADPSPDWYVDTNSPSIANRTMEANMYVEPAGSLPGVTVTFTGMCLSNTMTTLNPAANGWTTVAVIKDFAPDYSSHNIATVPVVNGARFSVSLATVNDPARHVQYGFITTGPNVWPTDPVLPSYGNVVIAPGPSVAITPSVSGANVNLSFPSVTGYTYRAQYKNNLTDANWTNLGSTTNGTGSTIVLTNTHTLPSRFYRLSVQ